MNYSDPSECIFSPKTGRHDMLDAVFLGPLTKFYCGCGRIVDLDDNIMKLKHSLKKTPECTHCRNMRISADIESLNAHFDGIVPDVCEEFFLKHQYLHQG